MEDLTNVPFPNVYVYAKHKQLFNYKGVVKPTPTSSSERGRMQGGDVLTTGKVAVRLDSCNC